MSRYIARLAAGYAGLIGCLVLIGWQLNTPLLRGELPGSPIPMMRITALCFLLCSVSLLSFQLQRTPRWLSQAAQGCVGLTIAIGLFMLGRSFFHWNIGASGWFESETLSAAVPYFEQMRRLTALVFLLVGVALLLLTTKLRWGIWLAQGLSCVVLFLEIATLIGYIFQAKVFYELVYGSIIPAPLTAISCIVLSVGLLSIHPNRALMQTVTSAAIGGVIIRRLLPWAIAIPLVLNWVLCNISAMKQEEVALYCMMQSIAEIGFFSTAIWWLARSLNRVDNRRRCAEQELQQINQALERQVADRTVELMQSQQQYQNLVNSVDSIVWEADPETFKFTFVSPQAERILGYSLDTWYEPDFWINHVHPDDRDVSATFCLDAIQAQQDHQFEYRMVAANGESVWLHDIVRVEVQDDRVVNLVGLFIDISKRKQIEAEYKQTQAALSRSEEHLRLATGLNQIGCWNFEVATGEAIWNDSHFRLMGLEPGETESRYQTWRDRVHPDDLAFAEQSFNQALENHADLEVEYRFVHPDGTIRWVLTKGSGIYDQSGTALRMLGVTLDISDRKQAEIALAEREAELRAIFEQVAVGVVYANLDGRYLAVNQKYCEMLDYSKDELMGKNFVELTHPDDVEADLALSQQIIAGEIPFFSMEKRYRCQDGSYLWADLTVSPIRGAQGELNHLLAIIQDINERKHGEAERNRIEEERRQAEAALRQSESKYRALVEALPDLIMRMSSDGTYLDFFPAKTFTVLGGNALVGQTIYERHLPVDLAEVCMGYIQQALQTGELQVYEQQILVEGELRTEEVRIAICDDDEVVVIVRDTTDRKQAEIALAASEAKFRSLVENANDIIYTRDLDGTLTYISPQITRIMGYDPSELVGQKVWLMVHPDDLAIAQSNSQRALEMRQSHTGQPFRGQRKDGSWCWLTVNFSLIQDADGQVISLQGIARDISERKQAELALQASEAKLNKVLNSATASIVHLRMYADQTWEYDYFSAGTEAVYGYSGEELMADMPLWTSRVHPGDLVNVILPSYARVLTGEPHENEFRFFHKDGSLRWIRSTISSHRDEAADCWIATIVNMDATNRKQAEAALAASEAKFRSLIENANDIIYTRDLDGTLTYVSPQVTQILGYSVSELLGQKVWNVMHPDDITIAQNEVQRMLETGESQIDREGRLRRKDGSWCWVTVNFSLMRDADGQVTGIQGMARDVSERKRLEAERKAAEEALWESRELLQRILDSVPQTIFWKDHNSMYLGCNQRFAHDAGLLSADEVIGKTDYDLPWTREEADWYRECDRHVMNSSIPMLQTPETQQRGDGQQLWIETNKVPLHNAAGEIVGVLGTSEDITERKQTELALQRQAREEQALNRVVQTIRNSLDLETIFSTAVQEAAQLVGVNGAGILQYQSDCDCWVIIADYSSDSIESIMVGYQIPNANNPIIEQVRRFEIVQIHNNSQIDEDDAVNQTVARDIPGAWLMAPLIVNGVVWGCFGFRKYQPSPFQDEQVELARRLADQLAIAIQQSELYAQLQQLNTTLEQQVQERTTTVQRSLNFEATLKRITDAVRDSLDEAQILQTAVQELGVELEVSCCDAALYDLDRRTSTVSYEYIGLGVSSGIGMVINLDEKLDVYDQILQGHSIQCCFTALLLDPCRNIKNDSAIFICPLKDERGVFGDMWLFKPCNDIFDELEVRLVQQVANQCAIALRQSQLYQAAQAQVIELERLNHLKDDFLSTVSHELRTPMSNIKMATQMLEITLSRLDILETQATVNRYFKILKEEGQREVNLINNLLDLSRLDADTEPLSLTTVTLQDWIPHLADPFIERVRRQNQQLRLEISEDLPALTTDLVYLERVLSELLNNACKYTPTGETITVSANVVEKRMENAEWRMQNEELRNEELGMQNVTFSQFSILNSQFPSSLQITVSNTGVEISSSECDRVFEKFYRIPNNDPWKHGGTGLGLALAKKFIEKLGGTIEVVSRQKQTSFIIQLPLHPGELRIEN